MADTRALSLDFLINIMKKQAILERSEDAFVNNLILTTFRHLPYIKKTINKFAKKITKNSIAEYALILGTTELLYMKSPDYAIINSYVDLVKRKVNRFAGGFVNAVLRNIARNKTDLQKDDHGEFFSPDFRKILLKSYDEKTVDLIEKESIKEPSLDITLKENSSVCSMGKILPLGSLRLEIKGKIEDLPDYEKGSWWVQDFSSALPVKMLGDIKDKKVLDICAAPGGKTAQLLAKNAKVTALDISETRLQTLQKNLNRLHLNAEEIICIDALEYLKTTSQKYDVVLLDAPCSATGTLRRHPETAYFKNFNDVKKQSSLQKKLLNAAAKVVKAEGILIYCTCSLCREEGEAQIEEFINNHADFEIVNLQTSVPEEIRKIVNNQGVIRVLPQYLKEFGGADGFFVACLKHKQ